MSKTAIKKRLALITSTALVAGVLSVASTSTASANLHNGVVGSGENVVVTVAAPVALDTVPTNREPISLALPAWPPIVARAFAEPTAGWLAEATGAETTALSKPATKAEVAVIAMRLRIVVFDIFFLSLVRIRNFLTLARRSFDLLIPFPYGTHV